MQRVPYDSSHALALHACIARRQVDEKDKVRVAREGFFPSKNRQQSGAEPPLSAYHNMGAGSSDLISSYCPQCLLHILSSVWRGGSKSLTGSLTDMDMERRMHRLLQTPQFDALLLPMPAHATLFEVKPADAPPSRTSEACGVILSTVSSVLAWLLQPFWDR